MTLPELDYSRKREVEAVAPPPHPAPEVTAREATPEEIPLGARRVIKAAREAGWEVRPTYARGTAIDRHGAPGALMHSLAVRMRLPGTAYGAVAVWMAAAISEGKTKWSADCAYALLAGWPERAHPIPLTPPRKDPGALSLATYLIAPSRLTDS